MSVQAAGITADLDGPLPVARRHSLLATPGIVKSDDRESDTEPRWMNGVSVVGYAEGVPQTWEPCTTGTERVKDEGETGEPIARFDPIAVYFPLHCSTIGMSNTVLDRWTQRVERVLDVTISRGVEAALVQGVPFSNNPFIGDTGFLPLAADAVSPQTGLSYLENAIASVTGRQGIIHATPAVVAAWGFGAGLSADEVDEDPPPRVLRTANGTPVISGSGYIGAHPVGPGGLPGPEETVDWVFATGQVEVRLGQAPNVDISEIVDRTFNRTVFRAERFVLYDWDKVLQVGVRIDWSL